MYLLTSVVQPLKEESETKIYPDDLLGDGCNILTCSLNFSLLCEIYQFHARQTVKQKFGMY